MKNKNYLSIEKHIVRCEKNREKTDCIFFCIRNYKKLIFQVNISGISYQFFIQSQKLFFYEIIRNLFECLEKK